MENAQTTLAQKFPYRSTCYMTNLLQGYITNMHPGQDLSGNTFWEFKDKLNANRFRRIAKPRRRSMAFADLQISPQWHQWLRQARVDPPSMQEQHDDLLRQAQLKHNAQLADERWASKPRYIERPKPRTPLSARQEGAREQETASGAATAKTAMQENEGVETQRPSKETKENPWAQSDAGSNPGSKWQPEGWVPGTLKR
jgi:NADH dehydrogenase [ubiquinone] 1 alpha subcomplex assembly factor 2